MFCVAPPAYILPLWTDYRQDTVHGFVRELGAAISVLLGFVATPRTLGQDANAPGTTSDANSNSGINKNGVPLVPEIAADDDEEETKQQPVMRCFFIYGCW